jgi:hypothetical protein
LCQIIFDIPNPFVALLISSNAGNPQYLAKPASFSVAPLMLMSSFHRRKSLASQGSSNMAKKPKSNKAKSNVPENYERWYADIFDFLEHEKDHLPNGRSDLEIRYLETCQLAIAVCES